MRFAPAALALLAPLPAFAQDADTAAVLAPVDAIFAALTAKDGQALLANVRTEGKVTVAIERDDGTRTIRNLDWVGFAANLKPGPERLEERMPDPLVRVDGDIAMVWGKYSFLIDGKVHHCGVNHFDLIREDGRWKVLNISWSQHTIGCDAK